MSDRGRDDQLEQILEELRKKREQPDALRIADVEKDIAPSAQLEQPDTQFTAQFNIAQQQRPAPQSRPDYQDITSTTKFDFVKPKDRDKRRTSAAAANAKLAKREFVGALYAGEAPPEQDPINKRMLAPGIERGPDAQEQQAREQRIAKAVEQGEKPQYAANHPLFTKSYSKEFMIPQESEEDTQQRKERLQFETSEIILDGFVQRADKKGVLNVRDNLDDNFREFFGDTIIIDKQSLSEKAQRQRKLTGYIVDETGTGISGPVFEENAEEIENSIAEYRSEEETGPVLDDLTRQYKTTRLRVICMAVLAVLSGGFSLLAALGNVPALFAQPRVFYGIQLALVVATVAIQYKPVFLGLGKLFAFKPEPVSFGAFAALMSLSEAAAFIILTPPLRGLFGSVMIIAYFVIELGCLFNADRILSGFETITGIYDKYATAMLEDADLARSITRGVDVRDPQVLMHRPTGFTDNFLAHSYSSDGHSKKVGALCALSIFLSLGCGTLSYLRGDGIAEVLSVACGCAVLCLPFAATLAGNLPIARMHRSLSKVSAVVPGYSAVNEITRGNCVVLSGSELFPKGNVLMHGIKTFERERIDTAILCAASVIVQACDTMAPMFFNVIQGKTEMLYEVDGIEYEPGYGFTYWIEKRRVLLGTRELLLRHGVEVPSSDYESRYTKTNTRDAMYLAVGGSLYAMFVISYSANEKVAEALAEFEREDLNILIHTRDFNITAERIARLYKIPVGMVSLIRQDEAAEITQRTEYASHTPSAMTHIGSLTSFIKGYAACNSVQSAVRLSSLILFIGVLIGMVFAVALTLLGSLYSLGMLPVLLFQAVWCLLLVIVVMARRY